MAETTARSVDIAPLGGHFDKFPAHTGGRAGDDGSIHKADSFLLVFQHFTTFFTKRKPKICRTIFEQVFAFIEQACYNVPIKQTSVRNGGHGNEKARTENGAGGGLVPVVAGHGLGWRQHRCAAPSGAGGAFRGADPAG